ncbi:DUF4142 domain-containing protein [Streptomyces sp. WI04-05B]|uniref:DUF4142 domain-containing protein n=1 Tax=Streptomyces TaxID=1883 RepID=UPI0029B2A56E|nr:MULTISPECIES: DUF4142 domain-containing protein [unclassified Streptomyces]MDX2546576.1 DUF4142 domain-containing protein [Streptomyces sp. WI04-05B]MDX2587792.1 DUF4142 domain-containing protein [Streptomyces sp. WI04-05A]MDX3751610.1 DUF4142 domain-containing protein [Streptomyces sp. AK08-02]
MPRFNHSALVIAALTTTIAALSFPVWSYADRSGTGVANTAAGTVNTQWGPLTASDRNLIVRVRLAGLWEAPAGEKAMDKSSSASVKAAADHLLVGHSDLDERVRKVAAQLNVELPNQPNEAQQGFLAQMDAAQGKEFDRVWASLLRKAHGTIFPDIATIRNQTQNSLVRQLATDTNQTVLDHITMLEKTGAVDFDAIANGTI